jgi:hypothetical protein
MVCDGLRIPLGGPDARATRLTLLKLDEARLMAVLADVTAHADDAPSTHATRAAMP